VGNTVDDLPYGSQWANAYDQYGILGTDIIPASAPNPIYGTVNQVRSGAISNYHGMNLIVKEQIKSWLMANFNYTWSHNLDEVSNGGLFAYGFASGQSIQTQLNPNSLRAGNYGNSDYDVRHNISGDFLFTPKFTGKGGLANELMNGWELSGKIYYHTGMPYSIIDNNVAYGNTAVTPLATVLAGAKVQSAGCGKSALATPCLNAAAFYDSYNNLIMGWSNQTRNQYRAAGYFNLDMGINKNIRIKERMNVTIGAMAYNLFNHANMPFPNNVFSATDDPSFGIITGGPAIGVPTSPYGNFLGFDSSPRLLQLHAKFTF